MRVCIYAICRRNVYPWNGRHEQVDGIYRRVAKSHPKLVCCIQLNHLKTVIDWRTEKIHGYCESTASRRIEVPATA
jgi:hypothetical protein